jgi:hypothetical protein
LKILKTSKRRKGGFFKRARRETATLSSRLAQDIAERRWREAIPRLLGAQQNPQVRSGGTLTATLVGAGELPISFSVNANNVENVKEKGSPVDWVRLEDHYRWWRVD